MLEIGNIPVAQAGDDEDSQWALKNELGLTLSAYMFQGRLEGDRLGFKSGGFYLQDAGDGLPHMMVRLPDRSYEDKGIIGSSIITDKYVYTEPFGGLQYKGAGEEWDYHSIRTTAWGKGTGVAVGNYDNYLVLACNTGGVKMVYEKGGEYKHELPINDSTNLVTSKRISISLKADAPMMIYGGDVSLPVIAETSEVYYRQWATTESGMIIHETISDRRWNSTNDPFYLDRFKAEKVTFTAGETAFHVEASEPMPVADNGGAIDIILHWEFKEAVTVYGDTADNVKFNLHYEEGAVEQVATQEWTTKLTADEIQSSESKLTTDLTNSLTESLTLDQVTEAEKQAQTETAVRAFSPKDVADMSGATYKVLPKGAGTHILTMNTTYVPDENYQYEHEKYKFEDKAGTVKIRGKLKFALYDNIPFFEIEQSSVDYRRASMTLDISDCYMYNNPTGYKQGIFIRKSCGNVVARNAQINFRAGTFIDNIAYNWVSKPDTIEGCYIQMQDNTFTQTLYKNRQRFVTLIIKDCSIHMNGIVVHFVYTTPHFRLFDISGNSIKNWGKNAPLYSDYNNPSAPAKDLGAVFRYCDNEIDLKEGYSLIWQNVNEKILTEGNLNIENNRVKTNYSRLNNVGDMHYVDPRSVCHTIDARLDKGIGVLLAMSAYNYKEGVTGRKYKGKPIYRTEVDGSRSFGSTLTENGVNGVTEVVECKLTYTDGASNKYRYTVDNMYISSSQQARIGVDTAGAYAGWLRLWVAGYTLNSAWVEFIR